MDFDLDDALENREFNKMIEGNTSVADVLKWIAAIPTEVEKDAYIKRYAEAKGVDRKKIENDLRRINKEASRNRKQEKKEPGYIAMFPDLVDIVLQEGNPAFLVWEDGELRIKTEHEMDGQVFVPPPRDNIQWLLPRADEVIKHYQSDSPEQLYNDLVNYHKSISELPYDYHYNLLAIWDIHTYLVDKFQYSPYIWLYAIPERGKSRTGKGCIYVAFRGIDIECMREANLIRYAQDLAATLFIDTLDLWKKAERNGTEDFLLKRFEKGATVGRVLNPDKGPHLDMKHFRIYGATMIATNEPVSEILATRAIQIIMPESSRRYEQDIAPEMGLPLKERLTAFRARYMNKDMPAAEKPCRRRLGDILRPLRQLIKLVCPSQERDFLNLVQIIQDERREGLSDTIEARIISAILQLEEQCVSGKLEANKVGDFLNEDVPERFKRQQNYYTRKMKSMGILIQRINGTKIIWDTQLFKKLSQRYLPETVQTVQTVQDAEIINKIMDTFDGQIFRDDEKCTGCVPTESINISTICTQSTLCTDISDVPADIFDDDF